MNLAPVKEQTKSRPSGLSILLIEDEPFWQQIIGKTLKTFGHDVQVRCVRSAKHAENLLYQGFDFDLVISDYYLEGATTGLDLWRMCRVLDNHVPFMMVSGIKESEYLDLLEHDSDYPLFLQKPFNVDSLRTMLKWYLEKPASATIAARKEILAKVANIALKAAAAVLVTSFFTFHKSHVETQKIADQPVVIEKATAQAMRAPASPKKFKIDDVFTPALKAQVQIVLSRADEVIQAAQQYDPAKAK